jgi:hypothetical protein
VQFAQWQTLHEYVVRADHPWIRVRRF